MAKYFSIEELIRSDKAKQHPVIDNSLPDELRPNITRLMDYLDKVREAYGAPIMVSSGYRCNDLNRRVGGATKSQHMQALAADLIVPSEAEKKRLFALIRKLGGFDQLIWEHPTRSNVWVHVSVNYEGQRPRGQVLDYNGRGYKTFTGFGK